jgi:tetratricopeptide (TPR) repeat protein
VYNIKRKQIHFFKEEEMIKIATGLILMISMICPAQEMAKDYFIQARAYDMVGQDSLALNCYEKALSIDSNSKFLKKEVMLRYIRKTDYDKVLDLIGSSTDIFKSLCTVKIEEEARYTDGDAVAKFTLYCNNPAQAQTLWMSLIMNAVAFHHLDSAMVISDSFVKNMPQYPESWKIQSKLLTVYKKISNLLPIEDRN